jgi:carboxyl-terminal processing protease
MSMKLQVALYLLAGLVVGCRTTPPAAATSPNPPPLALETFDEAWRIMYETHFDTNFNGHNWLEVQAKYRPRVEAAKTQKEVRKAIEEMLKLLDVSHLALVPGELADLAEAEPKEQQIEEADEEESGTLGMHVRYAGTNLLVAAVEAGLSAADAGVRPGWILNTIGGMSTAGLWSRLPETLDERRRNFLAWRAISAKLSGAPGSEVELEFLTGAGEVSKLKLRRETARGEAIQFGTLPVLYAHLVSTNLTDDATSIGLIRFNIWMLPTALAFHRAIDEHRGRDGMIIDLRGNIGGVVGMIIGVAGHFVTKPLVLGTLVARDNTFKLPANPRYSDASGKRVEPFGGPVAILVDEITASASEVFTGGLQEHGRVRVFGRTTAGQALPAVFHTLPNGDILYHPVADFITPKGERFEGRGVVPDVKVPLDRAALLRGVDPIIEAAREWIVQERRKTNPI